MVRHARDQEREYKVPVLPGLSESCSVQMILKTVFEISIVAGNKGYGDGENHYYREQPGDLIISHWSKGLKTKPEMRMPV